MAAYFRIVQTQWATSAMTGEGARLYGGRWNPPGIPAVYLAESRTLAALEILVHAPREVLRLDWTIIEVEVPDGRIEPVDPVKIPTDWRNLPSSPGARHFGEAWLRSRTALAIRLPSVIIPEEHSLLLNPSHPDSMQVRVNRIQSFRFDPRLVTSAV